MSKYKLWDQKEIIYTHGAPYRFTPEKWIEQFPWAEFVPCVISGEGAINGSFCMPYPDMLAIYKKAGCDFTECETMQDHLDAIEAFEDERNKPSTEPTTDERIAAALEYQVMASLPDEE